MYYWIVSLITGQQSFPLFVVAHQPYTSFKHQFYADKIRSNSYAYVILLISLYNSFFQYLLSLLLLNPTNNNIISLKLIRMSLKME